MKLYKIRDWAALFENNRSRTVKELTWVPIPNRHDGENFSTIMAHEKGAEIYAAWVLMLQVASRCQPRGSLLRDNKKPHDAASLSVKTRAPKIWFEIALNFLENHTDWLEIAQDCQRADSTLAAHWQHGVTEGKGMEGNGIEGKEDKNKESGLGPSLEEVKAHGQIIGMPEPECERFWHHFESSGWIDKNGHAVRNWKSKQSSWKVTAASRPLEDAHKASERPTQNGHASSITMSKEYERVIARIKQLKEGCATDAMGDRFWDVMDRMEYDTLLARRNELRKILNITI